MTNKLAGFLRTRPATPFLALDVDVVKDKYLELRRSFPHAAIHYAIKANPARKAVALLAALGSGFDVASRRELDLCLSLGVAANRISYGNTIKKARDIAYAFASGVRSFAFDSEAELEKIATHAPGAGVMCRLLTTGAHADWPLSKKFGCALDMAFDLLLSSRDRHLEPLGLTFHVGSQQTDPEQWREPLEQAAGLYREMSRRGIELPIINVGGGFPARYRGTVPSLGCYARAIGRALADTFGASAPRVMLEPGRSLVADAGVIQSEVVLVARKARADRTRWVYLDVGKFGGLAETLDESIKYRLRTPRRGRTGPVVLAGPTCDSADILYERTVYELPLSLASGDRVEILSAGAYTSSYASGFNGFPPLRTYCL
jgi:ornithine decarboxylase